MTKREWFRNGTWTGEIEAHFFERLARAKSQKDQYISIQAATLVENCPRQALELADYYFEHRENRFCDLDVLGTRAKAFAALGDKENAVAAYAAAISKQKTSPNQVTFVNVDAALFISRNRLFQHSDIAFDALKNAAADGLNFPILRFKWFAASAILSDHVGERSQAKAHAQMAISAANEQVSGITGKPGIDIVKGADFQDVMRQLKSILGLRFWQFMRFT
jgi:tetratricopeptide (TPR) repeat protein